MLVVLFTTTLLLTGSSILNIALDQSNTIPLGTFITWAGMVALPLSLFFGSNEFSEPKSKLGSILSKALKLIIIFAVLWVPISYLLAGNISFSFSEKSTFQGGQQAMRIFWYLSYGIPIGTVVIFMIHIAIYLLNRLLGSTK